MRSKTLILIGGALLALLVLASVASASLGRTVPPQDPWFTLAPRPDDRPAEPGRLYLPLVQYHVPELEPTATPTARPTATATATPSRTPTDRKSVV